GIAADGAVTIGGALNGTGSLRRLGRTGGYGIVRDGQGAKRIGSREAIDVCVARASLRVRPRRFAARRMGRPSPLD
ncbi:MAG: hypothetical protein ACE5E6_05225, partial [Phycisphaerae bacterium]